MEDYEVIISLASNCQQEENLSEARKHLGQILFDTRYTKALWTKPITSNKQSPLYLNQLVYARTGLSADLLINGLKDIEEQMGRTAELRSKGIVPIDLDLMKHGDTLHHLNDWERPYIKALLEEDV